MIKSLFLIALLQVATITGKVSITGKTAICNPPQGLTSRFTALNSSTLACSGNCITSPATDLINSYAQPVNSSLGYCTNVFNGFPAWKESWDLSSCDSAGNIGGVAGTEFYISSSHSNIPSPNLVRFAMYAIGEFGGSTSAHINTILGANEGGGPALALQATTNLPFIDGVGTGTTAVPTVEPIVYGVFYDATSGNACGSGNACLSWSYCQHAVCTSLGSITVSPVSWGDGVDTIGAGVVGGVFNNSSMLVTEAGFVGCPSNAGFPSTCTPVIPANIVQQEGNWANCAYGI